MEDDKANASAPKVIEIDLAKLSMSELRHQMRQIDQEIMLLQDSVQTLKMAQNKFQESKKSVERVQKYPSGQTLLVPLTGSMYVDGQIEETDAFIINVGTGYYLRKDAEGAKDYFTRRLNYVTTQIEKIQIIGNEKSRIKEAIISAVSAKIVQAQQQQQQQPLNIANTKEG